MRSCHAAADLMPLTACPLPIMVSTALPSHLFLLLQYSNTLLGTNELLIAGWGQPAFM